MFSLFSVKENSEVAVTSPYKLSSITETSKNWLQASKMLGTKLSWFSSFLVLKRIAASMDLVCINQGFQKVLK